MPPTTTILSEDGIAATTINISMVVGITTTSHTGIEGRGITRLSSSSTLLIAELVNLTIQPITNIQVSTGEEETDTILESILEIASNHHKSQQAARNNFIVR